MIDLLKQLIATPSFSREEGPAADLLEAWMRGQGLPVHRLGNNLWCETPGTTEKTLLLNAHIDTVKPSSGYTRDPFCPTLEGDTLYGLGNCPRNRSLIGSFSALRPRKRYAEKEAGSTSCSRNWERWIWASSGNRRKCRWRFPKPV